MTQQPRLLADYAAVPTPRERRHARATNRAAQLDMFDDAEPDEYQPSCAVCASLEHETEHCPHGTAPSMFCADVVVTGENPDGTWIVEPITGPDDHRGCSHDPNTPEHVAARRAMFQGFGWTTSS